MQLPCEGILCVLCVGLIYQLAALHVCGHLVGISWKQDTLLADSSPQLLSISVPVRTKVNWKVYTKNPTKYKSWIFMLSILILQTENNFIMRNLSNVPKFINCMLFSWSVNALTIFRHKYHIITQYNLTWHFIEQKKQRGFQQCLNEQVQAESPFLEVVSLPSVFQEEDYWKHVSCWVS